MRRHLTYANVVASLALFAALGGGAYAAIKLPRNSVGSAQIKPNAVRSSDVKDGALTAKDFALGQLPAGAQGPKGDAGTNGTNGLNGKDGLNGTARAYGFIAPNGAVSRSKNVGIVEHSLNTGDYCIHLTGGIDPGTTGVVVSAELESSDTLFGSNGDEDLAFAVWLDDNGGCTGSDVVEILTGKQSFTTNAFDGNVSADEPFFFAVP